jgi:hypothetical protein
MSPFVSSSHLLPRIGSVNTPMLRAIAFSFSLTVLLTAHALADCDNYVDQADCLRCAAQDYQDCLRRWSQNPNPNVNIDPGKCAEQRSNDENWCRQNITSLPMSHFAKARKPWFKEGALGKDQR